jgi:mono/diheme cytochrome c family protein
VLAHILTFLLILGATVGAFFLIGRARRWKPAARWSVFVAGGLVGAILLAVSVAGANGLRKMYTPRGRPVRDLKVEATPERIARGQHIANTMCVGCHSLNGQLPLSGGRNLSDEPSVPPLGILQPINLTPAGPLAQWTDGEIFRAVRDGADNNGRRLPVMSSQRARYMSDEDLYAVIAYLRSQPPVQHETSLPKPNYLAVVMDGAGLVPYLADLAPDTIVGPSPGVTLEYGEYLVRYMGCDECHGPTYTGGGGGVLPVGPNLRSVKGWDAPGFIATMRTGKTPFGKQLDSVSMPWKVYGRLTDDELTAVHRYLASLD